MQIQENKNNHELISFNVPGLQVSAAKGGNDTINVVTNIVVNIEEFKKHAGGDYDHTYIVSELHKIAKETGDIDRDFLTLAVMALLKSVPKPIIE